MNSDLYKKFGRLITKPTAIASAVLLPFAVQSNFADASQIPAAVSDHVVLGTAYDSGRRKFLNHQPVDGCVHLRGRSEAKVTFKNNTSYDDVLSMLSGGIEIGVNFPVVRANAGATIATETAASKYVSSFTLYSFASPPKEVYDPININTGYTLSTTGNELAEGNSSNLYELAGDEFVSEIAYGAYMLVNMRIEYLNEKDKLEIGGELDVDIAGGIVNVSGKLNYLDEDEKQSVRIVVRSIQNGGDPLSLFQTIPNNIMACTLENPKPCFDLLNRSVAYAKKEFPDQLNVVNTPSGDQECRSILDPSRNAGYNVVYYNTSRYDEASVDLLKLVDDYDDVTFVTKTIIEENEKAFKDSLMDQERADRLLTQYTVWLDEAHAEELKSIKEKSQNNAWLHFKVAEYCRDNPFGSKCHDYNNQVSSDCSTQPNENMCIASYDETRLKIPSAIDGNNWAQCENARSHLAQTGAVQDNLTQHYRALGWAPIMIDNRKPELGISAWMPCQFALDSYGDFFQNP